jgi:hypothetical protein
MAPFIIHSIVSPLTHFRILRREGRVLIDVFLPNPETTFAILKRVTVARITAEIDLDESDLEIEE